MYTALAGASLYKDEVFFSIKGRKQYRTASYTLYLSKKEGHSCLTSSYVYVAALLANDTELSSCFIAPTAI